MMSRHWRSKSGWRQGTCSDGEQFSCLNLKWPCQTANHCKPSPTEVLSDPAVFCRSGVGVGQIAQRVGRYRISAMRHSLPTFFTPTILIFSVFLKVTCLLLLEWGLRHTPVCLQISYPWLNNSPFQFSFKCQLIKEDFPVLQTKSAISVFWSLSWSTDMNIGLILFHPVE